MTDKDNISKRLQQKKVYFRILSIYIYYWLFIHNVYLVLFSLVVMEDGSNLSFSESLILIVVKRTLLYSNACYKDSKLI